jgi:HAD superfamily hydrolase (TIGR01509 family)
VLDRNARGVTPRAEFLGAVRERFALSASVDELYDNYRAATWAAMAPVEGVVAERLRALRAAGWKVACVTNGETTAQERTIERIGAAAFLDATIVSEAAGVRKPDPRILELAAQACGVGLEGAWMVGDSDVDVEAGAAAGATTVWLADGRQAWPAAAGVRPDHVVATLADALALVA